MNFYTLDYILSHQSLDATRRLAAIIVLLVVALAFSALYLRNRVKTRWRDAGIGRLVFSLVRAWLIVCVSVFCLKGLMHDE